MRLNYCVNIQFIAYYRLCPSTFTQPFHTNEVHMFIIYTFNFFMSLMCIF